MCVHLTKERKIGIAYAAAAIEVAKNLQSKKLQKRYI
jgi:hypothetical protein